MTDNWYFSPSGKKTAEKMRAERLEEKLQRSLADQAREERNQRIAKRNAAVQADNAREQGSRPKPMTPADYRSDGAKVDYRGGGTPPKVVGNVRVYAPPPDLPKAAAPLAKHVGRASFGMALRAISKLNPWLNAADIMAEAYRQWRKRNRQKDPPSKGPVPDRSRLPILPFNYVWDKHPVSPVGSATTRWDSPWKFGNTGSSSVTPPLWGQGGWGRPNSRLSASNHYWARDYTNIVGRYRVLNGNARRVGTAISNQPQPYYPWHSQDWAVDPNHQRWSNSTPEHNQDWSPADQVANPPADNPYDKPDNNLDVSPERVQRNKNEPHDRSYRGRGERKFSTKSARLAVALYEGLDAISEAAEIVEAFYDALPKDVRDRWDAKAEERYGGFQNVPANFGQYGIGGLPYQLEALYYNWHKVDVEKALYGVLKNSLSDSIIGGYQKHMPKNSGSAHEQGEMEFAQSLSDAIDYLAGVK